MATKLGKGVTPKVLKKPNLQLVNLDEYTLTRNKYSQGDRDRIAIKAREVLTMDSLPPMGEVLDGELQTVQQAIDLTAELGKSLRECCARLKIPYGRAYVLINNHPELVKRWNHARVEYLRTKVEDMEAIALDPNIDVQRARLLCDNIKWEAQRVARHIYGDQIIVAGNPDAPLITQLVVTSNDLVKRIRGEEEE